MENESNNRQTINKRNILPSLEVTVRRADHTPTKLKSLRKRIESGDLTFLDFPATVFKDGKNRNHYRFYSHNLSSFASSFTDMPFLYNHDTRDVKSRHGYIKSSVLSDENINQTIRLTTREGMLDFIEGRIDRFSIGWHYDSIDCSICTTDWYRCNHWPGSIYTRDDEEATCEIYFVNPEGKEVSAVNTPAVSDTGLLQLETREEVNLMPKESTNEEIINQSSGTGEALHVTAVSDEIVQEGTNPVLELLPSFSHILSGDQYNALRSIINAVPNPTVATLNAVVGTLSMIQQPVQVTQLTQVTQPVLGHGPITSDFTNSRDRFVEAWRYHLGDATVTGLPNHSRDIRQLYMDMTGDYKLAW